MAKDFFQQSIDLNLLANGKNTGRKKKVFFESEINIDTTIGFC